MYIVYCECVCKMIAKNENLKDINNAMKATGVELRLKLQFYLFVDLVFITTLLFMINLLVFTIRDKFEQASAVY